MFIYGIRNKINLKIYIGYDTHPIELSFRWRTHQQYGDGGNKKLYHAMRKYGTENFEYFIIDNATNINELKQKEIYYIALYNSFNNKFGYNMTPGGDGQTKESHDEWFYALPKERQEEIYSIRVNNLTAHLYDKEKYDNFCKRVSKGCKLYWNSLSPEEKEKRLEMNYCTFKHQELEGEEREQYLKEQVEKWKTWFYNLDSKEKEKYSSSVSVGVQNFYDNLSSERRKKIDDIHRKSIKKATEFITGKSYDEIHGKKKGRKLRKLRSLQMSERENKLENKIKKADFWLVTRPNDSVIVYLGSYAMLKIFKNLTRSGVQWRAAKCSKNPNKRFDGYRIDKIKDTKELFHYMGVQFCK